MNICENVLTKRFVRKIFSKQKYTRMSFCLFDSKFVLRHQDSRKVNTNHYIIYLYLWWELTLLLQAKKGPFIWIPGTNVDWKMYFSPEKNLSHPIWNSDSTNVGRTRLCHPVFAGLAGVFRIFRPTSAAASTSPSCRPQLHYIVLVVHSCNAIVKS